MAYIHLITGGIRSGKSRFAEQEALRLSTRPLYLATARVWDEDFAQRIALHKARRGEVWDCIEEELYPSKCPLSDRVVLLDCMTLWATNHFFENDCRVEPTLVVLQEELKRLFSMDTYLLIVTNEVGLGGIPPSEMQRHFADVQGSINQEVASIADRVTMMVSGIAVEIKK